MVQWINGIGDATRGAPKKVGVKKIAFGNQTWQLKIPKKMDYQG
jgi:hypothetical protein